MKLKNTLGAVIGSLVAATSFGVLAQGQGAVEVEGFAKKYVTDSSRNTDNGELYGGSIGYFLTDDVSLNLSHGVYRGLDTYNGAVKETLDGHLSTLEAVYHLGVPGAGSLRPYFSAGVGHQELDNVGRGGDDRTTLGLLGFGIKYYLTENVVLKTAVDGLYGFDTHQSEYQVGVGVGVNFGGASKPAPAPVPAPVPVAQPAPEPIPEPEVVPEVVRVELDVKFDFDKSRVKEESYGDIRNLADFLNQYPQTTTTVEGHTDSVGTDAYNQKLSERRASAVRDVLVNQYGVSGERVGAVGYGESRPVADNATAEGRAINRRVEAAVEAEVK